MDEVDARFERLIHGLREGDPRVLTEFFGLYGAALERIAARRIEPGMRRRVGPETVAQSACRTFLRHVEGGEYEITDSDSLWGLLSAIVLNKVHDKVRFHLRKKRALDREVAIDRDEPSPPSHRVPTPEEEAIFAEQFSNVVDSLAEEQRRIIDLRLQGLTQRAIADAMQVSQRTVRRLMADLEQRLLAAFEET